MRSHGAGTLRAQHAGQSVTLAGWVARRRDHGGVTFLDVRDATGVVQVVVRSAPEGSDVHELRSEFCVQIAGLVRERPQGSTNPELPTGAVEVADAVVTVLSSCAPLPFPLDERASAASEDVRLRHRYLDLRRTGPGSTGDNLRLRSKVNQIARQVLLERDFIEVETPTLTRSTPEGARDFLVPARLRPGSWYALPQSPQLFKQLLMVGGLERYFQIARCYRDEDFRADRQPEFTQLDVEMSFVEQEDVIEVGEALIRALWKGVVGHEVGEIPRLTFHDAMARYGSDKPDLRFGVELTDLTGFFADTPFRVFQAEHVGAVVMPGGAGQARKELDGWQDWAKARGARGLAYVLALPGGELGGPVAKNLSETERAGLLAQVGAKEGDCIFFAAGSRRDALALLGAARLEIGRRLDLFEGDWAFCWVVDAPMFEATGGSEEVGFGGGWTAVHHPFTSPNGDWVDRFEESPDQALAWAYDIVCNGNELGGGSIRIHSAHVQQRVFGLLGISEEEQQDKFGFLLDAFAYGPPPHGGIALGWDRVCMLLAGADSLRDVIAFPKTGGGYDPLTRAPTPITATQRAEAGIDHEPETDAALA
jgi:aspartyl-tRNA synthetase